MIRRLVVSSIFTVLTFALGVKATLLAYQLFPPTVSLCTLARHPDWYDRMVVRVPASASVIHGGVVVSELGCEAENAWAVVRLDESYRPAPKIKSFLDSARREIRKADLLVVGRFDKEATKGCYGPRFGIHAISVELKKSPVTVEPLPHRDE